MIPKVREAFNAGFQQEYYENLQQEVLQTFGEPCAFRISETPVFISREVQKKVFEACDAILVQIWKLDLEGIRKQYAPEQTGSGKLTGKPHFLAIDFGLCYDTDGGIIPQLIELQAFPSLMFYQPFLGRAFLNNYPNIPAKGFHYFLDNLDEAGYHQKVKELILGGEHPDNVILMELFPEQQKTRLDFWATRQALGIEVVCMTKVIKKGKKLYYKKDGVLTRVHRIYNRVIFDELARYTDLQTEFDLYEDLDVEWVTHPDWFFVISKCIMPLLEHKYIPESFYLNTVPADLDLSQYVLKPLFSFAGKGIDLNPTRKTLGQISDPQNYLLQKKVEYASLIKTNTEKDSKVELRILYIREPDGDRLVPVINLTRMGKGGLINVSHLTQDTWIGSSISFFEDPE